MSSPGNSPDEAAFKLTSSSFLCAYRIDNHELHTSYVDLNQCLGVKNGAFDTNGHGFTKNAIEIAYSGSHLRAKLRNDEGTWTDSVIDVTEIVHFENGILKPVQPSSGKNAYGCRVIDMSLVAADPAAKREDAMNSLYQQLAVPRGYIRCCVIFPGQYDDVVQCSLYARSLDDPEPYQTLSYTWGSATDTVEILVDGIPKMVTRNLRKVMRRLREMGSVAPIWIDALCINQSDNEEKSVQVAQMSRVYSETNEVLAWLGDETQVEGNDDYTRGAYCDMVRSLFHSINSGSHLSDSPGIFASLQRGAIFSADPQALKRLGHGLEQFATASWFSRIWTVQEIALPKSASLLIGDLVIPAVEALTLSDNWSHHKFEKECCLIDREQYGQIADNLDILVTKLADIRRLAFITGGIAYMYEEREQDLSIISALVMCRSRDATDIHDKIYGLLGVLGPVLERLPIDYADSAFTAYADFSHLMMARMHDLDIWDALQTSSSIPAIVDSNRPSCPSWAVNFDTSDDDNPNFESNVQTYSILRAVRERFTTFIPWALSAPPRLVDDVLLVHGIEIDEISDASKTYWPPSVITEDRLEWLSLPGTVLERWLAVAALDETHRPYIGNPAQTTEEAFWRTIVRDHMPMHAGAAGGDNEAWRRVAVDMDAALWAAWKTEHLAHKADLKWHFEVSRHYLFSEAVSAAAYGRVFFRTKKGYFGLGPRNMLAGDRIFLVQNSRYPCILRPGELRSAETSETQPIWRVLGRCYVHGIMEGEMQHMLNQNAEPIHLR